MHGLFFVIEREGFLKDYRIETLVFFMDRVNNRLKKGSIYG